MFSEKQVLKYKRTKYTRELLRYLNRLVSYVSKKEDLSKEDITKYIDMIFKPFEGIEKVRLDNPYHSHLEEFVEKSANLPNGELEADEIKKVILHDANQLQKTKRKKDFRSVKHKGKYDD